MHARSRWLLLIAAIVSVGCQMQESPGTQSGAGQNTDGVEISPKAQGIVDEIHAAYRRAESMELAGELTGSIHPNATARQMQQKFTGSFQRPNRFRQQVEGEWELGSTGKDVYLFNPAANTYFQAPVGAAGKLTTAEHGPVLELLEAQNPALLFLVAENPLGFLLRNANLVVRLDDAKRGGEKLPLVAAKLEDGTRLLMLVDPKTHLLRELRWNRKAFTEHAGAAEEEADLTITYTTAVPGAKFPPDHFSWTPPPHARNVAEIRPPGFDAAQELVGKAAPEAKLTTLAGEEISLTSLRGKVVVLEFWATWCPPCAGSLAKLEQMSEAWRELPVAVFAVNVGEDRATAERFLKGRKLEAPAAIDERREAAMLFRVNSLPQTIVIDRSGVVRHVWIGANAKNQDELRTAVPELTRDP